MWNNGSVIRSWLLELAGAPSSARATIWRDQRLGRRLRRGPLDGRRGDRPRRARPGHHPQPHRALPQPSRAGLLHRSRPRGAAQRVRRPRDQGPRARTDGHAHGRARTRRASPTASRRPRAPTQANPLREGLRHERMRRAVHHGHLRRDGRPHRAQARARPLQLLLGGFLPPEFTGRRLRAARADRRPFREHLRTGSTSTAATARSSRRSGSRSRATIEYQRGDFDDPAAYAELAKRLDRIDRDRGTAGNRLFYLAVPPSALPGDRRAISTTPGSRRAAAIAPPAQAWLDARHRREAVRLRPRVARER